MKKIKMIDRLKNDSNVDALLTDLCEGCIDRDGFYSSLLDYITFNEETESVNEEA